MRSRPRPRSRSVRSTLSRRTMSHGCQAAFFYAGSSGRTRPRSGSTPSRRYATSWRSCQRTRAPRTRCPTTGRTGYHRSTRQWLVAGLVLGGVLVCSAGATLLFVVGIPGLPTRTDTPPGPAVAMAPEPALSPRLAVPVRELPSPTIEPVPQAPLTIVLRPRRDCWVSLRIDGESVVRRVMRAGEQETYGGRAEIILNVGDAGAFSFAINQRAGRAL